MKKVTDVPFKKNRYIREENERGVNDTLSVDLYYGKTTSKKHRRFRSVVQDGQLARRCLRGSHVPRINVFVPGF
jgi:hypothetical protein